MSLDRDTVVAALRSEDVAEHLGIKGRWGRGRWMRSSRCGIADHDSDGFGISVDGRWHCWPCDDGGDLLKLLALSEGLDVSKDFRRVLEIAAGIAGVEDDDSFGAPVRPSPRVRPAAPALPPIGDRIALAKRRAAWVWDRLFEESSLPRMYLRDRGVNSDIATTRESIRVSPMRIPKPPPEASQDLHTLWGTMRSLAIVVPVRSIDDGRFVDLRARRVEPRPDQPKIIGMLGGVTTSPAEAGKTRKLVGCYGHPDCVEADHVVIVEGAMDYLTALAVWPNAQVLGATEAGSLALVAGHAARQLAAHGSNSRMTIIEQNDPPRTLKDGRVVPGAADESINENPNSAAKVAARHLGPRRVEWLYCNLPGVLVDGHAIKDLNDLVRAGADVHAMITAWTDEPAGHIE